MTEKNLFEMKFHEEIVISTSTHGDTRVRRVYNGWIYTTLELHKESKISLNAKKDGFSITSVFVPQNS